MSEIEADRVAPVDRRKKDHNWFVVDEQDQGYSANAPAILAVLLDLRDQLREINTRLQSANWRLHIDVTRQLHDTRKLLRKIERNSAPPKPTPRGLRRKETS